MQAVSRNKFWVFALVASVGLVGAAAWAERQQEPPPRAVRTVEDLSTLFRQVSQQALPSIVSIETTGKAVDVGELGFDLEDSPFKDFFQNDPRFREYFRGQRQQRPRQMPRQHGMGSGFIIDESGIVMTNNHVVKDAEEVKVRLYDGREFLATDIKTDPRTDVAILHIKGADNLQAIKLGNSDETQVGDWVLAIGSPFGLDMSVTAGIISAKGRGPGIADREDFIQTDAAINPGNSGGPLINVHGEVIGINTAISSRSGGYDGIGFAIPINMAQWVGDQLVKTGTVKRAYLGVAIQEVNADLAEQFHAKAHEGAIVRKVLPNSPASDAEMEPGDVIVELNGKKVDSPRTLQGIVEQLTLGESYPVTVLRNGQKKSLQITAKEMPNEYSVASVEKAPKQEQYDDLGLKVGKLTDSLADQLGLKDAKGVVVTDVQDGSPASVAGVKPGDVVEKVGKTPVTTPEEFSDAVKKLSLKDGIVLHLRNAEGKGFVVLRAQE